MNKIKIFFVYFPGYKVLVLMNLFLTIYYFVLYFENQNQSFFIGAITYLAWSLLFLLVHIERKKCNKAKMLVKFFIRVSFEEFCELQKYKALYGDLPEENSSDDKTHESEASESDNN